MNGLDYDLFSEASVLPESLSNTVRLFFKAAKSGTEDVTHVLIHDDVLEDLELDLTCIQVLYDRTLEGIETEIVDDDEGNYLRVQTIHGLKVLGSPDVPENSISFLGDDEV